MCWACCPVPGPFNGRLVDGARVSQGQRRAENLVHNDRPAQVRDGRVPDGVEFVDGLRLVVLRSLVQSGDEVFIRRPRLDVPFFHAFFSGGGPSFDRHVPRPFSRRAFPRGWFALNDAWRARRRPNGGCRPDGRSRRLHRRLLGARLDRPDRRPRLRLWRRLYRHGLSRLTGHRSAWLGRPWGPQRHGPCYAARQGPPSLTGLFGLLDDGDLAVVFVDSLTSFTQPLAKPAQRREHQEKQQVEQVAPLETIGPQDVHR